MNYSIIAYEDRYRDSLRILNEQWLRKYFCVEPSDVVQLSDPEGQIINKGGYICFARTRAGEIVGVGALMCHSGDEIELSKMAVDEKWQGRGIGSSIIRHCIRRARKMSYDRIVLYTNSRLNAAIHLYSDYGFQFVDLQNPPYERADRKMELNLKFDFSRYGQYLMLK